MAITGLLLCVFLVVHLGGNLLMYGGPRAYNRYAETLHGQEWLVKIAEIGLLVLFLGHIYLAFSTWKDEQAARKVSYRMKRTKIHEQFLTFSPSNWMLVTGIIVLLFVLLHLMDFHFEARPDLDYTGKGSGDPDHPIAPFAKALMILQNPISMVAYLIGCAALGVHLVHGFWSAFQTLGWNHPKYSQFIKYFGLCFAVVIALGFISLPVWANFFTH